MVIFSIPVAGEDLPRCETPEEALRHVDWRQYGLPYCGVYLIAEERTGPVKVGISVSATKRVSQMQIGCPRRLHIFDYAWVTSIPTAKQVEAEAHSILEANERSLHGEWFNVDVAKGLEAVQWAALSLGIDLHTEIPDVPEITFYCQRLSVSYRRRVLGEQIGPPERTEEEQSAMFKEQMEGRQEERRRILRQKLGMTG